MPDNIPQEVIKTSDKTLKFWICLIGLSFVLGGNQYLLDDKIDRLEAALSELRQMVLSNTLAITRLTRGQEEFLRRLE